MEEEIDEANLNQPEIDDTSIRFISTMRLHGSSRALVYKNYSFLFNASKGDRCYWRCRLYKSARHCIASIVTDIACTKVLQEKNNKHSHPHSDDPEVVKIFDEHQEKLAEEKRLKEQVEAQIKERKLQKSLERNSRSAKVKENAESNGDELVNGNQFESKKGLSFTNKRLYYNNYLFMIQRADSKRTYWNCQKAKKGANSTNCLARIVADSEGKTLIRGNRIGHNHPYSDDPDVVRQFNLNRNHQKFGEVSNSENMANEKSANSDNEEEPVIKMRRSNYRFCQFCSVEIANIDNARSTNDPIIENFLYMTNLTLPCKEFDSSSLICSSCYENVKQFSDFIETIKSTFLTTGRNFESESVKTEPETEQINIKVEMEDDNTIFESEIHAMMQSDECDDENGNHHQPPPEDQTDAVLELREIVRKKIQKCDLCNLVFECRNQKRSHNDRFHPAKPKPPRLICEECGQDFGSLFALQTHIQSTHQRVENDEVLYSCKYCNEIFKAQLDFVKHMKIHEVKCMICSKVSKNRNALRRHVFVVHAVRKHTCDICGKTFVMKYSLNDHMHVHTRIKRNICEICPNVAYAKRSTLSSHRKKYHSDIYG